MQMHNTYIYVYVCIQCNKYVSFQYCSGMSHTRTFRLSTLGDAFPRLSCEESSPLLPLALLKMEERLHNYTTASTRRHSLPMMASVATLGTVGP